MLARPDVLPWFEAWERQRLLEVYKGLTFRSPPRPKYVFAGLRRHDYEFGPLSSGKRKTKAVFLPGNYRPIMGASPGTFFIKNGGNDGSDGLSDANAWATLSKITSGSFSAGDIIQLKRASSWSENFTIPSSGSEGVPITIQAYDSGAKPIINGQSGGTRDTAVYALAKTDIVISNLAVNLFVVAGSYGIFLDDESHRPTVEYCDVVGHSTGQATGMRMEDAKGSIAQYNDIGTVSQGIILARNGTYTDVWPGYVGYNTIHDMTDQDAEENDGIVLFADGDWTGMTVEHNDASGFEEEGFDLSASYAIVQFNSSHDAGSVTGQSKIGLKILGADNQMIVRYNHSYSIDAVGANNSAGIDINGDVLAYRNLVHDITVSGSGTGKGIDCTTASQIYNNTVVQCADNGIVAANAVAYTIQNNICDGAIADIDVTGGTVTGGYNCLVNDAAATVTSGSYSGGGNDLGTTDPLFLNAAGNDFHLKSNSPCIEAGTLISGLDERDRDGAPTDRGTNPDIGAFETLKGGPRGL